MLRQTKLDEPVKFEYGDFGEGDTNDCFLRTVKENGQYNIYISNKICASEENINPPPQIEPVIVHTFSLSSK